MRRLARPSLHWLLWLVIALLPLRGWAQAQMAAPAAARAMATALTSADATQHHADEAMPACHGHVDSTAAPTQGSICSLCDVCHASLGLTAPVELRLPDLPGAVPTATPVPGLADGPPSELFRPPRHPA